MSWHKHQEYDPTAAFIQNNRQQKLLDLKLETLDKLWFNQLKHIARDRLDITLDLGKLEIEKQKLKYYDVNMDVQEIKEHGNDMAKQLKKMKIETTRNNFNFDLVRERSSIVAAHLPKLTSKPVTKSTKRHGKKHTHTKKRRTSKLQRTRIFSVSDSNLHKSSKTTEKDFKGSENTLQKSSVVEQESFSNVTDKFLPLLRPAGDGKSADYRYLRHRMATSLALPPVNEVTQRRRKLSV